MRKFSGEFIARRLTLNYTPTHFSVVTDDKWFSFVMEQVLSNALKYTPSGTISIYGEGENTICVQDTGIGISREDLPRIFEKGYTGLNGRADHRASGIGLYLCNRICEKMGITITVQSQPDVGTTVKMTFPEQL